MRPRSVLSACEYRPAIAATNSSRAARLIRLIPDTADEHRSGANQMRQWLSFQEHSRRGNAASHPVCRAATEIRAGEGTGGTGCEGDPPRHPATVFGGGKDPHRSD